MEETNSITTNDAHGFAEHTQPKRELLNNYYREYYHKHKATILPKLKARYEANEEARLKKQAYQREYARSKRAALKANKTTNN